ncbi:quinone-dependent dihydroorotate dehydrogenase [Staphylococcus gallinarum]|uniref:quinone-dependent dihydroorotate dehydrogenase n=1 Tax=Staphylococcus gallinarum TaxID=1293 RepID=UPI001E59C817|nr:quinone-dependent dihydroorotate dehydrogenase [Staphylococcus gallinarum]MCD8901199.1 quinone-dependent dihydroorotate dehydrogenase [Staphylococcus gallinarum]MCD8902537.1 quinone-dependent dihydroorotate dehydrogenase [Staphylococcus gallinarum]MCD8910784.1 quinone-dependent dihydroorotate dehydrogenase [Staphylococcus gallinarum]MEB7039584.1 quinone-dependent dihydroorotate dehydrogenase [Staphylococcus gallinarum]
MYKLIKPILFKYDPEQAHGMTIDALKFVQRYPKTLPIIKQFFHYENDILTQELSGVRFPNPIGLAAGFDKSCEVPKALEYAGFGSIELGGITPKPQPGNPKPRMYRLVEDQALINRMGFNNLGMNKALSNLRKYSYNIPVGLNVGVNKSTPYEDRYQDYIKVLDTFKNDVTFYTVNISSPNTENLQKFHDESEFSQLCTAIQSFKVENDITVPIFIKLTSDLDLTSLGHMLPPITKTFDGIILANTTQQRDGLKSENRIETGGLSGRPLFERNIELIKHAYKETNGTFTIIGTGGIFTVEDVITMLRSGASLVQIYSALVFEGPGLTSKLNKALAQYLNKNGYQNVKDIIGLDA